MSGVWPTEDVDAVFAIVSSIRRSAQGIETPRDLQRLTTQRVGPVFTKRSLDSELELVDVATGIIYNLTFVTLRIFL